MAKKSSKPAKKPKLAASLEAGKRERIALLAAEAEAERAAAMSFAMPEDRFDRIARMARRLIGCKLCAITFLSEDIAWNKASVGLPPSATHIDASFCSYVLAAEDLFHVPDCGADERFSSHPWVSGEPHARFFAGAPVRGSDGEPIGSLSVFDPEPRDLSGDEAMQLVELAAIVESEIIQGSLAEANRILEAQAEQAASIAAVDPSTGLWNLAATMDLARRELSRGTRGQPTTIATLRLDRRGSAGPLPEHVACAVAESIRQCVRDFDVVGRVAEDTFMLALSNCTKKQSAAACERARALIESLALPFPEGSSVTASVGMASSSAGPSSMERVLAASAAALEEAAAMGNCCVQALEEFSAPKA